MERLNDDVRAVYFNNVIERYLIDNGIVYSKSSEGYVIKSGKDIIKFFIQGPRICIFNTTQNIREYFLFDSPDLDVIFKHYKLSQNGWEQTNLSYSEVRYTDDHLLLSSSACVLDNSKKESCPSKILFFSEDYLGNNLESTLFKLKLIDDFNVLGFLSSQGLNIDSEDALTAVTSEEQLLTNDIRQNITR